MTGMIHIPLFSGAAPILMRMMALTPMLLSMASSRALRTDVLN